ncbi:MAG: phosphatidylserine synthase [Cytophagaceae bacterium]|nr:phosphatidylserine synthase [Cytophagaceae bacterium]
MSLKKYVPNAITLGNLLSGCIALLFAVNNHIEYAALFVALGVFLDFFDGFFARLFKVQSEVGLQLDSLADMVTSGVVPGVVMYKMLVDASGGSWGANDQTEIGFVAYLGFVITLASAYRLAKFNVDDRQTGSFIGLPTPANTLFILSLPLIVSYSDYAFAKAALENTYVLLGITALSAFLLNAELPLFSLKLKSFSFKENALRYIFIIASLLLLVLLHYLAMPLIILMYVLLSLLFPSKA